MYKWQLDDLYEGFDSPEFKRDWERLQDFGNEFDTLSLDSNPSALTEAIELLEEYQITARRIGAFISLQLAVDTTNQELNNYRVKYSAMTSDLTKDIVALKRYLSEVEVDIAQDEHLAEYEFFLNELKESAKYQLDETSEDILSKLNISGAQAWSSLQTYLTSTAEEEYEGEARTLSELRNLAYDASPEVRKEAYEAELKLYDKIKDSVAFAINNIKKQVITTSKLRGYESPLHQTLIQSRMQEETLESLIKSIKAFLPEFQRYLKLKAKYLGHENGLPFYDLFAPIGESSQKFTVEEAGEYLVDNFKPFSQDLADLVTRSISEKHIDFLPRKGKSGGAFCSNLPFIKQSRMMLNFDGSLSSVITMAHELGHAYHGMVIQDHRPLNWSYSMPVAETASTFNETIVMSHMIKNASDKEEKLALIESSLQDTTQIIVDIYSRYYFESELFKVAEDQFLFSNQLEALMLEAQKAAYGDGLDPDYLHPFMWVNKGHYYSAGLSFYNFPYAYGGLFAKGLYTIYEESPEGFLDKYNQLLYTTTVGSVEDVAAQMGIDVTKEDFWQKSLASFVDYIDEFEELIG